MIEFETLRKLDIRDIWSREAHDFTPWLAENLDRLGEAVGIELELVEREAGVGDFSLDLLAQDLGSNSNVVIESQLSVTDHDHLGKLITYASGYDASVVLWLSTGMREEHRQAIDWLNQRTDASTEFFGVVVEVLQIGSSKPALQFRVAASPNEWRKSKKKQASTATSEKSERYKQYFQHLIDELRETHRFTNAKKAQPQNWYSFSTGSSAYRYSHSFTTGSRARVEIYIDTGEESGNAEAFDKLIADREQIEQLMGEALEWDPLEGKRACRIALYRPGSIDDSTEELQGIHEWAIGRLLQFKEVFGSRF